jgi:hypothetical protein
VGPVPAQMWQRASPVPGADVVGMSPVPGADVAGLSPVPVQMWQGWAPVPVQMWQGQSRCRCHRGEPGRGAKIACKRGGAVAPLLRRASSRPQASALASANS